MNIIFEPKVYCVGKQSVNDAELDRFLNDENISNWETDTDIAGQKLVEVAGRLCYMSFAKPRPGGNKSYIEHVLEVAHGSVLEHSVLNFIITGVSRSFTHELVRHRAGTGYSQLSQRFVDESDCDFVVPPALREEVEKALHYAHYEYYDEYVKDVNYEYIMKDFSKNNNTKIHIGLCWLSENQNTINKYKILSDYLFNKDTTTTDKTLRRKRAREAARSVLPNCTETKIFVTVNGRSLRHFIEMRGDESADQEIRNVAFAMLECAQKELPTIFYDYKINNNKLEFSHKKV